MKSRFCLYYNRKNVKKRFKTVEKMCKIQLKMSEFCDKMILGDTYAKIKKKN